MKNGTGLDHYQVAATTPGPDATLAILATPISPSGGEPQKPWQRPHPATLQRSAVSWHT